MSNNEHRELILNVIESAVANVQRSEEEINDLNVFPVPDGDTGSNMLATLLSAWENISEGSTSDTEILNDFARGALLGARGNSGVITSQIIRGLSEGVKAVGRFSWDVEDMKKILRSAKEYAYKAVNNPVEGTILSVVRALDEKYNREATSLTEAFASILELAQAATAHTPEQLPVLKEAGVVDSGAYGLVLLIKGALSALNGEVLRLDEVSKSENSTSAFVKADPTANIGYCTEFILTLREPEAFDQEAFKKFLIEDLDGNSLVMICEEDILKVHVHVKNPGKVFNKAQEFGEFSKMKSENMASQATEAGHIVEGGTFHVTEKINENELAIIAVSNGLGLDEEFATLGVNKIVSGGQSMNPSVQDFVDLIESLNYKNIVLLPNNSNIILTAETVKNMIQDKNIFVLGTKTLQQGLVAMYNISKEMIDFENYEEGVTTAFKGISEGQITIAVRDTEMNGVTVKDGQFISLKGKEILSSTDTLIESAKILVDKIIADKVEVITLINNEECSDQQLLEIEEYISSKDSSIDIERIFGGQSVYHLLIFGEE